MVIENDPSARMQVRTLGELMHPASCSVCGNGNCDDGYLDLGVFFDYEGQVYLCMTCAVQAGETIGMYTKAEASQMISHVEQLQSQVDELTSELNDVRPLAESISRFMLNEHGPVLDLSSTALEVVDSEPERALKLVSGSGDREPGSEEPVTVPRLGDFSGTKFTDVTFE